MSPRLIYKFGVLFFGKIAKGCLVFEGVQCVAIQLLCVTVDDLYLPCLALRPRPSAEVLSQHSLDEGRARLLRPSDAINASEHSTRECDRCLLFHTTIILPTYYLGI